MSKNTPKSDPNTLEPFNPAQEGHNDSLWYRSLQLRRLGLTFDEALRTMDLWVWENMPRFLRELHPGELERQVARAYERTPGGGGYQYSDTAPNPERAPAPPRVVQNPELIALAEKTDFTLAQLVANSPRHPWRAGVETLFPPPTWPWGSCDEGFPAQHTPWICYGPSVQQMRTRRNPPQNILDLWCVAHMWGEIEKLPYTPELVRCEWEFESQLHTTHPQFIVPNPMLAETGITQDGRVSQRCRANATTARERIYWVVEFDREPDGKSPVPLDSQARRLRWLSGMMKLVMVVHSGGKSLHGWFAPPRDTKGNLSVPLHTVEQWWDLAVALGADPAAARPEQAFRFPWGMRENGKVQRVLYFDHLPVTAAQTEKGVVL